MKRRNLMAGSLVAAMLPLVNTARAQTRSRIRIGVLTDLSGIYSQIAGQGSIACARMAAREFAASANPPFDIEIISADHHNDPREGATIATRWYDHEGVDMILDVPDSAVALAVNAVTRDKNKVFIDCGAGTDQLTGSACSPNTVHWSFDISMLARSTGGAFTQAGGSTWFFITADYVFGQQLEDATTRYVLAAGGRIQGSAAYPFEGTKDFKPLLRQAQQSGAMVLGLANAGADVTACLRDAFAIGVPDEMRIACLLMQLPDVHALGLKLAGGLLLTESFYWDLNDRTRAFTTRLMENEKPPGYPDMIQAGCYAGALHYLKAVAAVGCASAKTNAASVVAHMKAMPTDDDAFGSGTIRSDGRAMFPAYLFKVKTPEESSGPWDYYQLIATTPAEDAARADKQGLCLRT